ncbi:unnamed protein product [Linum trigynum]|uniref:Uncharacterized protein n=1 Tax=Linum trigynum TaxID=586398 RepID=A0AAV2GJR7_9ROSI
MDKITMAIATREIDKLTRKTFGAVPNFFAGLLGRGEKGRRRRSSGVGSSSPLTKLHPRMYCALVTVLVDYNCALEGFAAHVGGIQNTVNSEAAAG